MAHLGQNNPLRASVLDRLIHAEGPTAGGAWGSPAARERPHSVRELKQSIRRDLENLLNTRWRCTAWPPNLDELKRSLVDYGLPDFSGAGMGSAANRETFRRIIERAILEFEPRLKRVSVELAGDKEPMDRVLRFRINAVLQANAAPEPVVFDSALEPLSATFEVKGSGR